ncbi:hypothetical protein [Parazoarcus communis]|nr:hypothetical protein [Parazoarcus communis]
MRPLPGTFMQSTAALRMNMICSPLVGKAILERLGDCMRRAGSQLRHRMH